MQWVEITRSPKGDYLECVSSHLLRSSTKRDYVMNRNAVEGFENGSEKDGIVNGESRDQEVRAHTVSVRCSNWRRILRRILS